MLGWRASYVQHTIGLVETTEVPGRIRIVRVKDCEVPCAPFLPFIEAEEPAEPVKARHKRSVFYCKTGGEGYYLKKYSYRGTRRHYAFLRGFIWTIPLALRQFHKMLYLRECGAPVVEPVMAVVRRYGMLKQESLLVMRECRGVLLKRFLKENGDFGLRLKVMARTFSFLRILHSNRIHHGDMTKHNFIVTPEGELRAFDLDERKTKWLGQVGNRRELKKWVGKSVKMLGLNEGDNPSQRRERFRQALAENYPEAVKYLDR